MSKQSISNKANIIRNETEEGGNTRGRVASVIDDINESKVDGTMKDFLDVFQDATDLEKAQFKDIIGIDGNFNEAKGFDLTLID